MGGGKGEIDIDITGGAEPRDDYARVSDALPVEWASFEDGAGEVENMPPGDWVNDGGPPWYFEFVEVTLSDYDFFAFSLYLFFSNEVSSVGALAASGDYYMDLGNNRVYIYGYDGGGGPAAPTAEGYCHAVSEQFTVAGAGPIVVFEKNYESIGGMGVKHMGSFLPTYRTAGGVNTTEISSIVAFNFQNGRCYGFALNSNADNQHGVVPSRKGRGGFYYSEDDGVTWNRSFGEGPWEYQGSQEGDQPLYDEPVEVDIEVGEPGYPGVYQWDLKESWVPYANSNHQEMTDITNATAYVIPTGPHGFMPMSGDGTFGAFFTNQTPGNFFTTGHLHIPADIQAGQSYGRGWRIHPQIPYHANKPSLMGNGVISGNSMNLNAVCRDARTLVDPVTYGGNVFGITRNKEVLKMVFDAFTWYGGSPSPTKQYTLPGLGSSANKMTSTYDPLTGKMWLHAFTRYSNVGGAEWGFYYSRSDDEGASWSTVNFPQVHDPHFNSGNWRYQGEARHMHTIQFLTSPESQTLWLSMYSQKSFGFLSYRYIASHLFRSLDHGVTWDKISGNFPFDTGSGSGTRGWGRGCDGYYRSIGNPSVVFLGDPLEGPPTEFYVFAEMYGYEQVFHFKTNLTESHGDALDSITFPAFDEEPHIDGTPDEYGGWSIRGLLNVLNPTSLHPTFLDPHAPNWDVDKLPCGFQRTGSIVQKMNDYYFRSGGFGKHYSWGSGSKPTGCDNYRYNPYDRGDYVEFTLLPLDAVITGIADESGFIIRAQHVNELRQKLQQLNATVRARGTNTTNFGIDVSDVPTVKPGPDKDATPVRDFHYGNLRREFETKIRTITAVEPGGSWVYTDEGVDLTDEEYDMPTPVADGPEGVSIRTLLGMRKIIQSLYLNGWFCACYSYCPCQTDITISGGGSKK